MHLFEALIAPLAPHQCVGCTYSGSLLCANCAAGLSMRPPSCYRCGALSGDFKVCPSCRSSSHLRSLCAPYEYNSVAKQLVATCKYRGARSGAKRMAELIQGCLPKTELDVVTFVPTATTRVRKRGFDHAALLARHVGRTIGVPVSRLLRRQSQTQQVGNSRRARLDQAKSAYILSAGQLKNLRILLVDDVVSTGSSLEACAKLLREAGARVDGLVFARQNRE